MQARIHLNANRANEAQTAVEEALRTPQSAEALTMQASILHARGDLTGAVREYSRALQADPTQLEARLVRSGALLDLQRDKLLRPSGPERNPAGQQGFFSRAANATGWNAMLKRQSSGSPT